MAAQQNALSETSITTAHLAQIPQRYLASMKYAKRDAYNMLRGSLLAPIMQDIFTFHATALFYFVTSLYPSIGHNW